MSYGTKFLIVLALWLLVVLFSFGIVKVLAQEEQNIELIGTETPDADGFYSARKFQRFHDKASKVEFICALGSRTAGIQENFSISCFPTGRKW